MMDERDLGEHRERESGPERREDTRKVEFRTLAWVFLILLALVGLTGWLKQSVKDGKWPTISQPNPPETVANEFEMVPFASNEEAKEYWAKSRDLQGQGFTPSMANLRSLESSQNMGDTMTPPSRPAGISSDMPSRYSETNVQVAGIDEPDIVKTNGQQIFYNRGFTMYGWGIRGTGPGVMDQLMVDEIAPSVIDPTGRIMPPPVDIPSNQVAVVQALPVGAIEQIGGIDKIGDLLLSGKTLIVLAQDGLWGFDVSVPESPVQKWRMSYFENSQLVNARMKAGVLYVMMQSYPRDDVICPIQPLMLNNSEKLSVPCTDIYHPRQPVANDSTFTVLKVDPVTGAVQGHTAFVGTAHASVMYMSAENLYTTYQIQLNTLKLVMDFFATEGKDLLPENYRQRLVKLQTYDISEAAQTLEMGQIMNDYMNTLDANSRRAFENNMQNRMQDFAKKKSRDVLRSGIVRINLDTLRVEASSTIPGYVLNQFAMDEYEGHLRVATTIEGWLDIGGQLESANDVYVLNEDLQQVGAITDLGLTERIYSARFIGDRGYLVTFRQTDPFYILDMSDPRSPKKTGELKIPGYSSYLHPLDEHHILGIGKEGAGVKLSVFNVDDPMNPQEAAKYMLDEYNSEILQTHHAFLYDEKHKAFFVPGDRGGYIFTLKDPTSGLFGNSSGQKVLNMETAVSMNGVKRALFINDYLYVVGDEGIAIIQEGTWNEVNRMKW